MKMNTISQTGFLWILIVSFLACKQEDVISFDSRIAECEATYAEQLSNKENSMTIYQENLQCIVGAEIPIFESETIDGKTIDYNYFKGKVNIINFWFKNCKPCLAEISGFNSLTEKYKGKKVNFLAVSTDPKPVLESFLQNQEFNFDHIPNGREIMRNTFKSKSGFPLTIIVDKNNIIRHVVSGGRIDSTASQVIQDKLIPVIDMHL